MFCSLKMKDPIQISSNYKSFKIIIILWNILHLHLLTKNSTKIVK